MKKRRNEDEIDKCVATQADDDSAWTKPITEFKVMPWLRALRDRHAREVEGLSVAERLRRSRAASEPLMEEFFRNHPEARPAAPAKPAARVAETRTAYGKPRQLSPLRCRMHRRCA